MLSVAGSCFTILAGHWFAFKALEPVAFLEVVVCHRVQQMSALYTMAIFWVYANQGNHRARHCVSAGELWMYHGDWMNWVEGWVNEYCPGCVIPFAIREFKTSRVSSRAFKLDLSMYMNAEDCYKSGGLLAVATGTARNFLREQCRDLRRGFLLGEINYRNWGRIISFAHGMQGKSEHVLEVDRAGKRKEAEAAATLEALGQRAGQPEEEAVAEEAAADMGGAGPSGAGPSGAGAGAGPSGTAAEEAAAPPAGTPAAHTREREEEEGAMEVTPDAQGRMVKRSKRIR